jgi:alanyl-tRNA synthetase
LEDTSGERYLEFWNLVFMQYNRDEGGKRHPLPKPSIDTGAGLERVVSLKMGVDSVFETDILRGLIRQTEKVLGVPYDFHDKKAAAFRVIADHLRCLAFAIADGAQPSNVDRGYVLRKVLRRAVRYGRGLGADKPFLAQVLPELVRLMGEDYPELTKGEGRIAEILTMEEESFLRTLRRGGNLLNQTLENGKKRGKIPGEEAFKLKDTYGLPLEEILLIAKDSDLEVDLPRYQELEEEAKLKSRQVHKTTKQIARENLFEGTPKSLFVGYSNLEALGKVTALVKGGELVDLLEEGDEGGVVLDQTPFYAEMGGQVGDVGALSGPQIRFRVADTQSPFKGIIAHFGQVEKGALKVGETVTASVDRGRREKIQSNHTATHLLHWALHHVLGEHVKQAGSVVEPERLRFDFSHHKSLSPHEIMAIEDLVNAKIRENLPVKWYEIPYEEAIKRGEIKQFFGDKYGSIVRVIDIEESKELCGGTHISDLGKIGLFRIVKEGSIAAGTRRIEAVTGKEAEQVFRESERLLDEVAAYLKVPREKLQDRLEKILEENRQLAVELKNYKKKELEILAKTLLSQVEQIGQVKVLIAKVSLSGEEFKLLGDELMGRLQSAILVLANAEDQRASILVRISDALVSDTYDAQKLAKKLAPIIEGSGGGKANTAQAGGKAIAKIDEALKEARLLLHG